MKSDEVRVRFAPSPTGLLHIGNARTALFNLLFARGHGGRLVLRIEDTDLDRSAQRFADAQMEDLRWLGIHWDEGPDTGGPHAPYRQTERLDLYHEFLDRLKDSDLAYPCYCSPEELERERKEQLSRGLPPRYSGRCRRLSATERSNLEKRGIVPTLRFRVDEQSVTFDDAIHGPITTPPHTLGDFIVVRSTGIPAYNFAVVVDDILMRISHVIRGEDHVSNTPRQILLYRFFGKEPPVFAHHPLIVGKDRAKLSKRHGAVSVTAFREIGILPQALANYLAYLGGHFPDSREIYSLEELARIFDLGMLGRKSAAFDPDKLHWFNAQYLRDMSPSDALEAVKPFIDSDVCSMEHQSREQLEAAVAAVLPNAATLKELAQFLEPFLALRVAFTSEATAALAETGSEAALSAVAEALQEIEVLDEGNLKSLMKNAQKKSGLKGPAFYHPLRAALTGSMRGPELDKAFLLLGKERILDRVREGREFIAHGPSHEGEKAEQVSE